jgi:hypothetical protein
MKVTKDMLRMTAGNDSDMLLEAIKAGKISNIYELCEEIKKTEVWRQWKYEKTR